MGQHKYNPTAVAAKNGELPPKPKKMGKREWERMVTRNIFMELERRTGICSIIQAANGGLDRME